MISEMPCLKDSKSKLLNDLLWLMGNILADSQAENQFSIKDESFHRALYMLTKFYPLNDETWLLVVWNLHSLIHLELHLNSADDADVF
jgi:hypothetical protein